MDKSSYLDSDVKISGLLGADEMQKSHPFTINIDTHIEQIDHKGQFINLLEPIHLKGSLQLSQLLRELNILDTYLDTHLDTYHSDPYSLQIGVDEAGRGPLLGSVHVAAAILPKAWSDLIERQPLQTTPLSLLTDSKQLSEKKRDLLYPLIQQHATGYLIAEVPAAVIDQVNILQATMLGMRLCSEMLLKIAAEHIVKSTFGRLHTQILYDGNRCPELDYVRLANSGIAPTDIDCQAWVKGDARHTSMAAASVLAKVSRDQTMYALDAQYPQYHIAKHKGYPTRLHKEAITRYGVLPEHRRSFAPIRQALNKE